MLLLKKKKKVTTLTKKLKVLLAQKKKPLIRNNTDCLHAKKKKTCSLNRTTSSKGNAYCLINASETGLQIIKVWLFKIVLMKTLLPIWLNAVNGSRCSVWASKTLPCSSEYRKARFCPPRIVHLNIRTAHLHNLVDPGRSQSWCPPCTMHV